MLACLGGLIGIVLALVASIALTSYMQVPSYSVRRLIYWHLGLLRLLEFFLVISRPEEQQSSTRLKRVRHE